MSEQQVKFVELPEDEMVAVVIRSFFDVPDEETTDSVIEKTDPGFVKLSRSAVRNLMFYWSHKIKGIGLGPKVGEDLTNKLGLGEVDKPEGKLS